MKPINLQSLPFDDEWQAYVIEASDLGLQPGHWLKEIVTTHGIMFLKNFERDEGGDIRFARYSHRLRPHTLIVWND